jgi:Protein of unknown function (DUF1553)/Protein of unknown function (DUF1549)
MAAEPPPDRKSIDFAKGREWWSLRPLTDPAAPAVRDAGWPVNDIDRFILAKLDEAGLSPAPPTDKAVLLRRLTYDLIGLPPSPQELAEFVKDDSPGAFAKAVERLLASPQYGERWGRWWLDVVRYSDTAGDNSDFPVPQMHEYRDWVINAFNRDLPYDQFVTAQLAGDLMPAPDDAARLANTTATGYLANARRFGSRVDDYPWHLTIEDTIDNFGRAFLGLTVGCARCHDHKFDPISAQDYYALYGVFQSTRFPWPGIELEQKQRDFVPSATPQQIEAFRADLEQRKKPLAERAQTLTKARDITDGDLKAKLEAEVNKTNREVLRVEQTPPPYPVIYGVADRPGQDAPLQLKGDPTRPGPVVPRRFLEVINPQPFTAGPQGSGRLELAARLFDKSNPLTARVIANRIWLWHFDKGLVPTPNDFGKQGKPASHPELLDWLASRLIDDGWSIKAMHRRILLSKTWQQASAPAPAQDPANALLSAFPRHRLDAGALRDTLLVLSGQLDPAPGGGHPFPPPTEWQFTQHNPFKAVYDHNKRSVYLMTQRTQRHPYLGIFDAADPAISTGQRTSTTTPLQSLYLMNNPFVHTQAAALAKRLLTEKSDDPSRLLLAWQLTLARSPNAEETAAGLAFLITARSTLQADGLPENQLNLEAWSALTRSLFRTNEFLYLD